MLRLGRIHHSLNCPRGWHPLQLLQRVAAQCCRTSPAVVLASAPCKVSWRSAMYSQPVMLHSKRLSLKLHLPPDVTTVEPQRWRVSCRTSEVSVVSSSESLSCPVTAMEAVCESFSCPSTATEAAYVSSSCPAMAMEAIYESSSCPVTAMEATYEPSTCPATAPETMKALPVLSVSALPVLFVLVLLRFQILSWFPAQSASLRWSAAPPWRSVAQVWWSSARVWWSSAQVWGSPAPPWWALVPSAPPWWALVRLLRPGGLWSRLLHPGGLWSRLFRPGGLRSRLLRLVGSSPIVSAWLPALPQSTASPLAHGPGPPFLPLFRLRSTTLLDSVMFGASEAAPWGGGAMSRSWP